jgi:hypothetical protein
MRQGAITFIIPLVIALYAGLVGAHAVAITPRFIIDSLPRYAMKASCTAAQIKICLKLRAGGFGHCGEGNCEGQYRSCMASCAKQYGG